MIIINSGSAMELDSKTIAHIQRLVREKNIHTIWFENDIYPMLAGVPGVEVLLNNTDLGVW